MKPLQVKIFLWKNGLSLAGMARELKTNWQSEDAIRVMLSQMVHGHRFYPSLAKRANEKYGLQLKRPVAKFNGDDASAKKAA